jgi:tetratricopeptide (TPR) repeat protein
MLGLEIAWHCIRARRREEFARYMISGSDEAIEKGAHVSAERALLTAIPHLDPGVKEQAQFRLALVLQDQGRWAESREVLPSQSLQESSDALSSDARATIVIANAMIESQNTVPFDEPLSALIGVMAGNVSPGMKLRAAAAAASYGTRTYHSRAVEMVGPSLDALFALDLTPVGQADLALSRAQLVWPLRRFDECMDRFDEALRHAPDLPVTSPLAMRVRLGRGFTLTAQARYHDAIEHLTAAARIAFHIGNDAQAAGALTALAQCHTRLGHYDHALSSVAQCHKLRHTDTARIHILSALHYEAFANAMMRSPDASRTALTKGDLFIKDHEGTWLSGAWQLWSADTLWCLGDDRAAIRRAQAGIVQTNSTMHNVGIAGAFCRWCAVLGDRGIVQLDARAQFLKQVQEITLRDALDQAEIGLAANSAFGVAILNKLDILRATSCIPTHLPEASRVQLRQLGLRFPEQLSALEVAANPI